MGAAAGPWQSGGARECARSGKPGPRRWRVRHEGVWWHARGAGERRFIAWGRRADLESPNLALPRR